MSFQNISSYLFRYILQFIPDNKTSSFLVRTCSRLLHIGNSHGYVKYISYGDVSCNNINLFVKRYCDHVKSIISVSIYTITDPQYWIPSVWPKKVYFKRTRITEIISPPLSITEDLQIIDLDKHNHSSDLVRIDWKKLPKLKRLNLDVVNIDFTGIEACKDLEIIFITVYKEGTVNLPDCIGDFKKLIHIGTNCVLVNKTHFCSRNLTSCTVYNHQEYTTAYFNQFSLCTERYKGSTWNWLRIGSKSCTLWDDL